MGKETTWLSMEVQGDRPINHSDVRNGNGFQVTGALIKTLEEIRAVKGVVSSIVDGDEILTLGAGEYSPWVSPSYQEPTFGSFILGYVETGRENLCFKQASGNTPGFLWPREFIQRWVNVTCTLAG